MTLIIENVKEEHLSAFKGLVDKTNSTLIAETSDESLDLPTQETIESLKNSYTTLKTKDYAEFESMIENE